MAVNLTNTEIAVLIAGMAIVTYLPRALPMVLLKDLHLNPFFERFLKLIPYAALGALIFPGVLFSTQNIPSAIVGGVIAVMVAFIKGNLLLTVLSGILGTFLYQLIFL